MFYECTLYLILQIVVTLAILGAMVQHSLEYSTILYIDGAPPFHPLDRQKLPIPLVATNSTVGIHFICVPSFAKLTVNYVIPLFLL